MSKKLLVFLLSSFSACIAKQTIETVWGPEKVDHPLIEKLIESPALQRLKFIDQSGPVVFWGRIPEFSRFEHSVGVWALVKKAGGSLQEQASALLHDASHTVFSHIADNLFKMPDGEHSYQDKIHLWFLNEIGIKPIIAPYGFDIEQLDPALPEYSALEQPLPDMCADRIQYNLQTALIIGILNKKEIRYIVDHLHFENNKWFFSNIEAAKKFASTSLHHTKFLYGYTTNNAFYHFFSEALRRALEIGLIKKQHLHFGMDKAVLTTLQTSDDPIIKKYINACGNIDENYEIGDDHNFDLKVTPKFRGIDPLVKTPQGLKRLTSLDADFHEKFEEIKKWCQKGYHLRWKIS